MLTLSFLAPRKELLISRLFSWLEWGAIQRLDPAIQEFLALSFMLALALITYVLTRFLVVWVLPFIIRKTSFRWGDLLYESKVLHPLMYLVPISVLALGVELLPTIGEGISRIMQVTVVIALTLVVLRAIRFVQRIYDESGNPQDWSINVYAQMTKLLVIGVAVVLVGSALANKSPAILLSGLGALTALVILIFRDTVISLIANLQLTTYEMLKVGDWIEAPTFGANGNVVDVSLYTIKVQNWDNTYSMIPIAKLVDSSFINWRGMQASGGRRIKRALLIDQTSIRFAKPEFIDRLEKFELLQDYLTSKRQELDAYDQERGLRSENYLDGRHLTNLGIFREYTLVCLRRHAKIRDSSIIMVRYLAPTPQGLPLEIYAFTNEIDWIKYEEIQADIFDHLLAVLPVFELRAYQVPSSHDVSSMADGIRAGRADGEPEAEIQKPRRRRPGSQRIGKSPGE